MWKSARLLLGGLLSYLLGLYLSPRLLSPDYLISLTLPFVQRESSSSSSSASSNERPPIELPPLPPSVTPHRSSTGAGSSSRINVSNASTKNELVAEETTHYDPTEAYKTLLGIDATSPDPFLDVQFVLHRNGEAHPCSQQREEVSSSPNDEDGSLGVISKAFLTSSQRLYPNKKPLNAFDKYDFDALLTHSLAVGSSPRKVREGHSMGLLDDNGEHCSPTWRDEGHYLDQVATTHDDDENEDKLLISPLLKYCDMGIERTPIQLDHSRLVRVPEVLSLPCHFHTREGVRITSLEMLANLVREAKDKADNGECKSDESAEEGTCNNDRNGTKPQLHLYAVQAGRVFVFAPSHVGEIFHLPHVTSHDPNQPVYLQVLSISPRVFDIYNFFSREESAAIVSKALAETSESHKMKRSSTGASGYNVNSQRTSENGFDTHGKEAQAVKRRCMNVLGFDEYEESLTDGLQVLRYNKTTAYIPHLDWIDDYQKKEEHNYDSAGVGSNRFATILLYMSDLTEGDGGETVFSRGWPPELTEQEYVPFQAALTQLRESGDVAGILEEGSWEETMVARCRSRLAVRPHSSRAVLFYSQEADGTPDQKSLHGGCPVISGEKWAANLWVWNAPRGGFPGAPVNKEVVERNRAAKKENPNDHQKKVSFSNAGSDERFRNAELYFQETFWGKLGFGDPDLNVNTFEGHEWNVKVGDEVLRKIVISKDATQRYII
ncbi:hypothetical protein HJC23_001111 [Cyclotella cryptica]|uniref:Fe2OG dioxygenase domain-containing protein n=1 Tax=Cyclotella cryptica TaxID=29204 RepID=A0ABD3QQP8_9STRA